MGGESGIPTHPRGMFVGTHTHVEDSHARTHRLGLLFIEDFADSGDGTARRKIAVFAKRKKGVDADGK